MPRDVPLVIDPPLKIDDTLVLILGQTGAGKSTVRIIRFLARLSTQVTFAQFINHAAAAEVMEVGHGLKSQTQSLSYHTVNHRGRRFIFVDTPGFDDSNLMEDGQILRRIATWLKKRKCGALKTKLLIVYLVEISQQRQAKDRNGMSPLKLLDAGFDNGSLVIATTKWAELKNRELGNRKATQLSNLYRRSAIYEFKDSRQSAWDILDRPSRPPAVTELSEFGTQLELILPKRKRKRNWIPAFFRNLF
ncbi:hypothetical protein D9615_003470 [Tricholomella constricta]|uniref:G domain-containing protein n=1 Tax=Tricholomella constricta TaxID=117010 RepID=A0A8H5M7L8_9AGAR|nr:hypothetical protein D9615_003470 [Tricholomella constricta]